MNLQAAHQKMRAKNELLPALQDRFEAALTKGKILTFGELVADSGEWLDSLGRELDA